VVILSAPYSISFSRIMLSVQKKKVKDFTDCSCGRLNM